MSDYLDGMDEQQYVDLFNAIFSAVSRGVQTKLPDSVTAHIRTEEFISRNRPRYADRVRASVLLDVPAWVRTAAEHRGVAPICGRNQEVYGIRTFRAIVAPPTLSDDPIIRILVRDALDRAAGVRA